MRFMPVTAVTALMASLSISGVPLFNGFASKWSLLVAAVQSGGIARPEEVWILKCLPAFALVAILTSALTLASFIKFFGSSFLSRTSQLVADRAAHGTLEVGWMMRLPQLFLAAICVGVGVMPAVAFRLLDLALHASQQGLGAMLAKTTPVTGGAAAGITGWQGGSVFAPLIFAAVLGLMFLLALGLARLTQAQRRRTAPWLCGYAREVESTRYVAHNFYTEIKRWFGRLEAGRRRHGRTHQAQ
jgi:NADH:ubiquinone oxidoreductase subunit 5 (subunit L)/multisubunit Na+/H+ antiporter MnhA subunit